MFKYSLQQIAQLTNSKVVCGDASINISNVCLDSRNYNLDSNTIFIAIVGKQHNGHNYIREMHCKGCRLFWIQEGQNVPELPNANVLQSKNVLEAYQNLISDFRNHFKNPIVGITGSNGKTVVKEWLYSILSMHTNAVRSPRSYNSQIGVPLSLQLLDNKYDIAIIEAGISEYGEMAKLEKMISPEIGVFTNIGDAHQENFSTIKDKVAEKIKLFKNSKQLIYCADYNEIHQQANQLVNIELFAWSTKNQGNVNVEISKSEKSTQIRIACKGEEIKINIPYVDSASIENAITVCIAAHLLNVPTEIISRINTVPPVEMRLELKQAKNNSTIINDSYNSDVQSLKIALEVLSKQSQQEKKTLILSDIQQNSADKKSMYIQVQEMIENSCVDRFVGVGGEVSTHLKNIAGAEFYENTQDLLTDKNFKYSNEVILLKGARSFLFEKIASSFEFQTHKTVLEINMQAMVNNLNYYKSKLKPETKITVMVKAFSYGSGSYEIAHLLEHHKVDYLAVAFIDEGIELRNAGVRLPIIVMNPERGIMEDLFAYDLEPEIHNFDVLQEFAYHCKNNKEKVFSAHIKFDTGMKRYGFSLQETNCVIAELQKIKNMKVASVFSHLVGADSTELDDFTQEQLDIFKSICNEFDSSFDYKIIKHILNSAGIERFSSYQFDMVRLGIGLYGISAVDQSKMQNISTLKTFVSSLRNVSKDKTVGYSRRGKLQRDSKIAVLPIGYADGLNRGLSRGTGSVVINGQKVPIVGNICMDATMVDVTNIDVAIGDEVIIFGEQLPISEMAELLNTIPYEIITSVSRRVKRVYVYE